MKGSCVLGTLCPAATPAIVNSPPQVSPTIRKGVRIDMSDKYIANTPFTEDKCRFAAKTLQVTVFP
jgi:hypothetical protein